MKKTKLQIVLLIAFCVSILTLSIRGLYGNPSSEEINDPEWKDQGPLELSPDRGRFALTYSIVEDKSVHFSVPIAKFATPDLGYKDGKYVSLFAPGVSFIVSPGYIVGKFFGLSQIGTFAIISLFAIVNVLLIRAIAIRLGANSLAASISALIFIFATPAFSYAVTLYQHHISTFLILLSIYILLKWKKIWPLAIVWFLCATSIVIDYPNLFLMLPIGVYALGRIFNIEKTEKTFNVKIKLLSIATLVSIVFPLMFFLWFNKISYNNPFQFSGTVASVKAIDEEGKPASPKGVNASDIDRFLNPEKQQKSSIKFFETRELLSLMYIHLIGLDRGTLVFTPIILFGLAGIPVLYRKEQKKLALLLSIIGLNVLLYSMFGAGGWAFGSRYLIPSYSIMAILIAIALTKWKTKTLFFLFFIPILIYSVSVNSLGAITTSRNPPKVEAIPLEKITGRHEKYTFTRNLDYLRSNRSKSFIYKEFASNYLDAEQYYFVVTIPILMLIILMAFYLNISSKNKRND